MTTAMAPRSDRSTGTIVVVDQNDVVRHGYQALLLPHPEVDWVVGLTIEQARATGGWDDIGCVVIDAFDERNPADHLPGVAVVEHIRATTSGERTPRILVVSDREHDDALRRRMAEAGADGYCRRAEIREVAPMWALVLGGLPDGIPAPRDREAMHRLGITSRSRVNDGLRAAVAEQLVPEAGWVGPDSADQRARRLRFNEAARLLPFGASGSPADDPDDAPSLAQVQRFAAWASGT